MKTTILPYAEGDHFNGVFKYFQNLTNETDLSKTEIVAFSSFDNTGNFTNLFIKNYWASCGGIGRFFLIDFKRNKFMLDQYSYTANHWDFPRKFSMFGSNNKNKWTQLDEQTTDYQNDDNWGETLSFETQIKRRFRYIKLQMKEKRALDDYCLVVFKLELFGVVYSHNDLMFEEVSCKFKNHNSYLHYSIVFIISFVS